MKILIVEDDEFKFRELKNCLEQIDCFEYFYKAESVRAAITMISEHSFDCIVLDIALPSHDLMKGKGAPESMPAGGVEILMELGYFDRKDPVVIVTQYPQIEIDGELVQLRKFDRYLQKTLDINLIGVVLFDKHSEGWKTQFMKVLEKICG